MRIVVTGIGGLIGWHAHVRLYAANCAARFRNDPLPYDIVALDHAAFDDDTQLAAALDNADAVLHFAGVNRGDAATVEAANPAIAKRLTAARPFYNNVTATLIHQILAGEMPDINPDGKVQLLHAGAAAQMAIDAVRDGTTGMQTPVPHPVTVPALYQKLRGFHDSLILPFSIHTGLRHIPTVGRANSL